MNDDPAAPPPGGGTRPPHRRHLAAALHWPKETPLDWSHAIAAGLGMGVPVLAGAATGHTEAGLAAAVGGLMMSGVGTLRTAREQAAELALAALPSLVAIVAVASLAGTGGYADAMVVVLAAFAALLGGMSRTAAIVTTRFALFLLVARGAVGRGPQHWEPALLVLGAAVWSAFVSAGVGAVARQRATPAQAAPHAAHHAPATRQRFAHWRRTLKTLEGWQYTLRLAACLAIAMGLDHAWPDHHLYWVALTVALLIDRAVERLPVKVTQRTLGTLAGVLVAHVVLDWTISGWALAVVVGLLAAARPLLRARNYLAYTVVMTPLVIAILDAGVPPDWRLLGDRLVATLIGAALVLAANEIAGRWVKVPARA